MGKFPIIAVCGPTGTGKSKLAIDLARHLNGEVINADAVQLYKGIDIATNKVTHEETMGVTHHLLGCLDPVEGFRYNVHHYRRDCCRLIDLLRARGVTPVLVGGTHYYLEAVLWQDFLRSENKQHFPNESNNAAVAETDERQRSWPPEAVTHLPKDPKDYYSVLNDVNPEAAARLHPNDTRRLQQALLAHFTRKTTNSPPTGVSLTPISTNRSLCPRYPPPDSLILSLHCQASVLKPRLDKRVSEMVQRGLVHELDEFLATAVKSLLLDDAMINEDGTVTEVAKKAIFRFANEGIMPSVGREHWCRGILQSIGFKEFEDYLQLSLPERDSPTGQAMLSEAIEKMKNATRQYARRQLGWINSRFLRRPMIGGIPVYRLDMTPVLAANSPEDAELVYTSRILEPCLATLRGEEGCSTLVPEPFVETVPIHDPCMPPPPYVCEVCYGRVFVDPLQFKEHLKGRSHNKRVAKLKKINK